MKFKVALVTLVVVAVLVRDACASDVSRQLEKRDKRNFDSEFGSTAPDFLSIRDFLSGRNFVVTSRDFLSGMGYSSSLKYGPGLGLSSRQNSSPSSEDLEPSPSSPSPSSEDLVPPPSSPLPLSVSTVSAPYPVYDVSARDPVAVHRSVPYISVPVAEPVVVVAVSYGPSDPGYVPSTTGYVPTATGYVPSATGYVPSATGYVPTATDYGSLYGEWPFGSGERFRRTAAQFRQQEIAGVE